jgi:hypothetical protein
MDAEDGMNESSGCYCARCGREVPMPEGYGTTFLCEFFYCRDRDECRRFCRETGRQIESYGERMWRELQERKQ